MINELLQPPKETFYYRFVVQGRTGSGEPFQNIYLTSSKREAASFRGFLEDNRDEITRTLLQERIDEDFPSLTLLKGEVGNDISEPKDIPDELPFGEGAWDENDNVQLLKRALIERQREWKDGLQKAGNEIASNIPTFMAAGSKGDAGYIVASIGGGLVAAAIIWRANNQRKKFLETLKIWVEFTNNCRTQSPKKAHKILRRRMDNSGLLFSGIPQHDVRSFNRIDFIKTAEQNNLWYDKPSLKERLARIQFPDADQRLAFSHWLYNESLVTPFEAAVTYGRVMGKYSLEQVKDVWRNPRSLKTWKDIGLGLTDTPLLTADLIGHWWERRKRQKKTDWHFDSNTNSLNTNNPEDIRCMRIQNVRIVKETVDPQLVRVFDETLEDFNQERRDGIVMTAANVGETIFFGAHATKVATSSLALKEKYLSAGNDTGHHPPSNSEHASWMDAPEADFGLSLFSICLASGAYAHIGHEIQQIKASLRSRRAKLLGELAPAIADQYHERTQQPDVPAP